MIMLEKTIFMDINYLYNLLYIQIYSVKITRTFVENAVSSAKDIKKRHKNTENTEK